MDWFRSFHGAPTDPKWLTIAKHSGTTPGMVASLWWALMDHASQATPRGSVARFDVEAVADFYGYDVTLCNAVIVSLRFKQMIGADDMLSAWLERNPRREDNSTERVRNHRQRKKIENGEQSVTHGNAVKRNVTLDKIRVDKSKEEHTTTPSEIRSTDILFDLEWSEYPRKAGKASALKAWNRLVGKTDMTEVAAGIRRYTAYCTALGTEAQFIKHLASLLNSDEWREEWPIPLAVVKGGKVDEYEVWMAKTQAELV
jgi:hypothetical protein